MIFYYLHHQKGTHMTKLDDFFKGITKEWIEDIPKEVSII